MCWERISFCVNMLLWIIWRMICSSQSLGELVSLLPWPPLSILEKEGKQGHLLWNYYAILMESMRKVYNLYLVLRELEYIFSDSWFRLARIDWEKIIVLCIDIDWFNYITGSYYNSATNQLDMKYHLLQQYDSHLLQTELNYFELQMKHLRY